MTPAALDPNYTEAELRVMRVLWAADRPMRLVDVCAVTGISTGHMNYLLPELCDRGAIREVAGIRSGRGVPGLYVADRLRVLVNTLPWDRRLAEAIKNINGKAGVAA